MKLAAGENRLRLVSEPVERGSHFDQAAKKGYTCIGHDEGCRFCAAGEKPSVRFLYWVIDRKDGGVKLLEVGWSVVGAVKNLHDSEEYAFDDVPPYDVIIKKTGSGLDTEYSVMAARMNTELTLAERDEIAKQKPLEDIIEDIIEAMKKKSGAPATASANGVPTTPEEDDIKVENIPF